MSGPFPNIAQVTNVHEQGIVALVQSGQFVLGHLVQTFFPNPDYPITQWELVQAHALQAMNRCPPFAYDPLSGSVRPIFPFPKQGFKTEVRDLIRAKQFMLHRMNYILDCTLRQNLLTKLEIGEIHQICEITKDFKGFEPLDFEFEKFIDIQNKIAEILARRGGILSTKWIFIESNEEELVAQWLMKMSDEEFKERLKVAQEETEKMFPPLPAKQKQNVHKEQATV